MSDELRPITTENLLARVDANWGRLDAAIGRAGAATMLTPAADGWTPKDHLAHLTVWRRSLLALLNGESRPHAIGLTAEEYRALDTDGINAVLFTRLQDRPLDAVVADLRDTHGYLRARLAAMTDADLIRPYSHYQPHDPPHNPAPIIRWIAGNTFGHDAEHLPILEGMRHEV